ncbi:MAG: hypothetical protein ACOX8R_02520 [Bacillota bacterium]|jgi:hypothetical protein
MIITSQNKKIKVDSRDIEEITVERITGTDARSFVASTENEDFVLAKYPNRDEAIDSIKLYVSAGTQEEQDNICFRFPQKRGVSAV